MSVLPPGTVDLLMRRQRTNARLSADHWAELCRAGRSENRSNAALPWFSAERLDLTGLLGSGSFGHVLVARNRDIPNLPARLAVKLADPDIGMEPDRIGSQLGNEERVGRLVQHRNLARVYGRTEIEGRPALVLELVEGVRLSDLMERAGEFGIPVYAALEVAVQVCSALTAMHRAPVDTMRRGLLHRDLKPDNLIIGWDGSPKLIDFGLSVPIDESLDPGMATGTPSYMSPEQARGDQLLGPESDLYSLSLTLFELVTGRGLYGLGSPFEILSRVQWGFTTGDASELDAWCPSMGETVGRALSLEPEERYESAAELQAALVELMDGLPAMGTLSDLLDDWLRSRSAA